MGGSGRPVQKGWDEHDLLYGIETALFYFCTSKDLLGFCFIIEKDGVSSNVTPSQTLNKMFVFKISYCKMSFFLLADLHKSCK